MKRKFALVRLAVAALAAACAAGCAQMPLIAQVVGQQVSVTAPQEIPFPDAVTLELAPEAGGKVKLANALSALLAGESLEAKLGRLVKEQTQPLRRRGAQAFKQQLVKSGVFGHVVDQGGNVGLAVGVTRFGVAYDSAGKSYGLVLDLSATLSEPHVGVVWQGTRSAKDLGAGAKALAAKLDLAKVLSRPESLQTVADAAIADLGAQLLADLQQHPPLSQYSGL